MKFKSTRKWKNKEELEGLLFFAQRLDELVFDFSLDTYKPAALNPAYLCIEALSLILEIENEILDKANLQHVLDELEWSIAHDEVAKSLIELDVKDYILGVDKNSLHTIKTRLELLYNCLEPDKYLRRTFDCIFDAIRNIEKKRIGHLASTMVTTLLNMGYHQAYIYNKVTDFFFYRNEGDFIDSMIDLEEFLVYFRPEIKVYEVAFRVSGLIAEIADSCEIFNLHIVGKLPEHYKINKDKFGFLREDDIYIMHDGVEAYDPFSARDLVERSLEKLKNLFVLFHHKKGIKWHEEALIYCKSSQKEFLLKRPVGPMKKGNDMSAAKAAKELNRFIQSFTMSNRSFEKFVRVIDFHGLAISSEIAENQLINLWTSVETVIPSTTGTSKISNIINSLLPFLTISYTHRLIERLTSDLIIWNRNIVNSVLKKVPDSRGLTFDEKVALLLTLPECNDLRKEMYGKFNDFTLLRSRMFHLAEDLSSSKKILKIISRHTTKVEWQIRRIYRTRNLIVHSGRTPPYCGILIENLHSYLDIFMEWLFDHAMGDHRINTIEQAVELATLKKDRYVRLLSSGGDEGITVTRENFKTLLFP